MKIYDCFSYLDEDFLLDLRLNILNDFVDYFVIVEGNKTWQNNLKPFNSIFTGKPLTVLKLAPFIACSPASLSTFCATTDTNPSPVVF